MADKDDWEDVSIHAPRVGGDTGEIKIRLTAMVVSIHAPRVGGDGNVPAGM